MAFFKEIEGYNEIPDTVPGEAVLDVQIIAKIDQAYYCKAHGDEVVPLVLNYQYEWPRICRAIVGFSKTCKLGRVDRVFCTRGVKGEEFDEKDSCVMMADIREAQSFIKMMTLVIQSGGVDENVWLLAPLYECLQTIDVGYIIVLVEGKNCALISSLFGHHNPLKDAKAQYRNWKKLGYLPVKYIELVDVKGMLECVDALVVGGYFNYELRFKEDLRSGYLYDRVRARELKMIENKNMSWSENCFLTIFLSRVRREKYLEEEEIKQYITYCRGNLFPVEVKDVCDDYIDKNPRILESYHDYEVYGYAYAAGIFYIINIKKDFETFLGMLELSGKYTVISKDSRPRAREAIKKILGKQISGGVVKPGALTSSLILSSKPVSLRKEEVKSKGRGRKKKSTSRRGRTRGRSRVIPPSIDIGCSATEFLGRFRHASQTMFSMYENLDEEKKQIFIKSTGANTSKTVLLKFLEELTQKMNEDRKTELEISSDGDKSSSISSELEYDDDFASEV